jgi:cytochrome d ubiquinol oxidase subunit II
MEFTFDLNTVWFALIGVLFMGYAILDGFDLGVGGLHLFTKTDHERRIMINSIGPVWDGNEVWLVTGGGALFAAFPHAYATSFSGFYIAMMALLLGLIFRAVAIEFRSKRESPAWRQFWDVSFSISSIVSSLLIGVAMGNLVWGVPIDENMEFAGTFLGLLHPYALLTGLTTVALFMMHGAIYVVMKTEGELQARVTSWINKTIIVFIVFYAILTFTTLMYVPHMSENLKAFPVLFIIPVLNMLAIANIPREIHKKRYMMAFVSSCASMAALLTLLGIGLFPNLILSNPNPEYSLTIYNAVSSQKTLGIMLIIAGLGMPVVIAYTISIYWIFRGKVKLDAHSY